jgi:hypothetical protein
MNDYAALTVARTFTNVHDAHLAKSVMEAAGIDVMLADEHIVSMNWIYSNAVGGVKALVPEDQSDEAKSVLETIAIVESPSPPVAESGAERDVTDGCSRCGSDACESSLAAKPLVIFSWLFIGVPLGWPFRRRNCRECGLPVPRLP